MKKIFFMASLAWMLGLGASAQTVITNDYGDSPITGEKNSNTTTERDELQSRQSGFSMDYQGVEDGFGLGMDFVFNHFNLGGSMRSGKTDSYIKKNEQWEAHVGGSYRYFFHKNVFIEGRLMVGYMHNTFQLKGADKESEGNIFAGFTPRLGLVLGSGHGISIGYRWDFYKVKFEKDYRVDFFTIGYTYAM